jgi:hypothetical protein
MAAAAAAAAAAFDHSKEPEKKSCPRRVRTKRTNAVRKTLAASCSDNTGLSLMGAVFDFLSVPNEWNKYQVGDYLDAALQAAGLSAKDPEILLYPRFKRNTGLGREADKKQMETALTHWRLLLSMDVAPPPCVLKKYCIVADSPSFRAVYATKYPVHLAQLIELLFEFRHEHFNASTQLANLRQRILYPMCDPSMSTMVGVSSAHPNTLCRKVALSEMISGTVDPCAKPSVYDPANFKSKLDATERIIHGHSHVDDKLHAFTFEQFYVVAEQYCFLEDQLRQTHHYMHTLARAIFFMANAKGIRSIGAVLLHCVPPFDPTSTKTLNPLSLVVHGKAH